MSTPLEVYEPLMDDLVSDGFEVLAWDLYGRGFSSAHDNPQTIELFVQQMEDLLAGEQLHQARFHLVGLSLGGPITSAFTARYPERVMSVVWIAPLIHLAVPRISRMLVWTMPRIIAGFYAQRFDGAGEFRKEIQNWEQHRQEYEALAEGVITCGLAQNRAARRSLASTLHHEILVPIVSGCERHKNLHRAAAATGVPILVVQGKQDATCSFEHAEELAASLPGSMLLAIDNAGHYPHLDQRELVSSQLVRFFRDTDHT